jgi:hypothetical protein
MHGLSPRSMIHPQEQFPHFLGRGLRIPSAKTTRREVPDSRRGGTSPRTTGTRRNDLARLRARTIRQISSSVCETSTIPTQKVFAIQASSPFIAILTKVVVVDFIFHLISLHHDASCYSSRHSPGCTACASDSPCCLDVGQCQAGTS